MQVLGTSLCLSVELGFWIPIVIRIPDSKAQESGFLKKKFLGFRGIWIPLDGETNCIHYYGRGQGKEKLVT